MKKTKKLLSSIIALSMAAQGIVSVVNVSAATTGTSGKSISIDFEEYQDGQLPSETGWSFEKLPSGVEANTFFKVETIKDIDGVDTQAIVFNSRPDAENPYTYSDTPMLKYTFSQPIMGDYIEAEYDILLTPVAGSIDQIDYPIEVNYAEIDTEGTAVSWWGNPKFSDRFVYYPAEQIQSYRFTKSDAVNVIRGDDIQYKFSFGESKSQWVRVRKIYNCKEQTYSLWVNGQSMGTYNMVFPQFVETDPVNTPWGNGVSKNNGKMGGLSYFRLTLDAGECSKSNIQTAVDNISVNVLENYDPSAVSIDFESDSLGVMPSSVEPSVKLNGTELKTTNPDHLAMLNQMIKVENVAGRDGKQTKALHLQSQPDAKNPYDYSDAARALISFNNVETTDTKKCIEVSYDIKVIPTVLVDGALAKTGFMPYHMENNVAKRESVWGKTENAVYLYNYKGGVGWKSTTPNYNTENVLTGNKTITVDNTANYYTIKTETSTGEDGKPVETKSIADNFEGKWIKFTTIYDLSNHTYSIYQDNVLKVKDQKMPAWKDGGYYESTAVGFNAFQTIFARGDDAEIDYYVDNISAKPVDYKYKEGFTWDFEEVEVGKLPEGVKAESQAKLNNVTVPGDEIFNVQTTTDKYGNNTKALRFESKQSNGYAYADNNNANV